MFEEADKPIPPAKRHLDEVLHSVWSAELGVLPEYWPLLEDVRVGKSHRLRGFAADDDDQPGR
jgi:hypothetical protein